MVVDELPAWTSNRLKRLVRSPKRYLVDPSLFAGTLGIDTAAVLQDGDLMGRRLDTCLAAQLRAEATVSRTRTRLYHLRQEQDRHEIDIIAELGGQLFLGIEIKATSSPSAHDARHLAWLRGPLGNRFVAGIVLHTGPATYPLGNHITAAPISTMWTQKPKQAAQQATIRAN